MTEISGRDFGYDQDFVDFAVEMESNFKAWIDSLAKLAESPEAHTTAEDLHFLKDAGSDARCAARQLSEHFETVKRPLDRGDLFLAVQELAASAFDIGRRGSTSASSGLFFDALRQSARGKKSGQSRSQKSAQWKAWCQERAAEVWASRPRIKNDDLVDILRANWPKGLNRVGNRTISDHVTSLRAKRLLSSKSDS